MKGSAVKREHLGEDPNLEVRITVCGDHRAMRHPQYEVSPGCRGSDVNVVHVCRRKTNWRVMCRANGLGLII